MIGVEHLEHTKVALKGGEMGEPILETAVKWVPVAELPPVACQTWRLRTDDDFELELEGDFLVGTATRTLALKFCGVFAVAAHEDMGGKSMTSATHLPTIGTGAQAEYIYPLMKVENSRWLASMPVPIRDFSHYLVVSLTCTVEVIAECAVASWR
ncbi:MAG: hypothetical protein E5W98_28850 [Mesorhizobium sp.]|nr:MAG: hypothetical protein E5W98_28850 [Mesorhizobium sp.]